MCAHCAPATAPERAEATFDPPIDPWLRMRLAPVREARRPAPAGATVRDALRAIASARPDPAMLALELHPVRALLERERGRLRQRLAGGASSAEIARAEARLLDGTVIGLCHLGRLLEPVTTGMVPPLAALARGEYARRRLAPGVSADLLFLVAADPVRREHGLAVARFVTRELAGLGWQASTARRTVRGCLAERHLDPAVAADLSAARLVWGSQDLFADLSAGLMQPMGREDVPTMRGTAERSPGTVLAA
jgi:hypothetical protein